MGIPKWREVKYTDDGCCIFQCLACKQKWEARTSPNGNGRVTGGAWSFCPYCGVRWDGELEQSREVAETKRELGWAVHGLESRRLDKRADAAPFYYQLQYSYMGERWRDDNYKRMNPAKYTARQVLWALHDARQRDTYLDDDDHCRWRVIARWKDGRETVVGGEPD